MWHKAFSKVGPVAGPKPNATGSSKMPRTPSAFPFSGRLRRRAINPTSPKRVKAWGDGPLRPAVMYPVVEHTRTNCAARNHSRSRAPHHRTQIFCRAGQYKIIHDELTMKHLFLRKLNRKDTGIIWNIRSTLRKILFSCWRIGTWTRGLGNKRTSGDHRNC